METMHRMFRHSLPECLPEYGAGCLVSCLAKHMGNFGGLFFCKRHALEFKIAMTVPPPQMLLGLINSIEEKKNVCVFVSSSIFSSSDSELW